MTLISESGLSGEKAPFPSIIPDESGLEKEARRVLRRLCETGAVLVLAAEMEKAVVLRTLQDGTPTRTAVVSREVAQAFALKDWISCDHKGRVTKYSVTAAGRKALKGFLDEDSERKRKSRTTGDGASPFIDDIDWPESGEVTDISAARRHRYNIAESPLVMLSRRRDKDGKPFLQTELVQSGERFREDFELSAMGSKLVAEWERYLGTEDKEAFINCGEASESAQTARMRILGALEDLGPGLADILIRCCCFLEGLETAERRMGWSARSGKIVLRIALQRLRRHYLERHGHISAMIG